MLRIYFLLENVRRALGDDDVIDSTSEAVLQNPKKRIRFNSSATVNPVFAFVKDPPLGLFSCTADITVTSIGIIQLEMIYPKHDPSS